MPVIEQTVDIAADPQRVYELISRVEAFPDYADVIESVEPLGDDHYRWCVRAAGLHLHWDAEVTERNAPGRFAWQSVSGIRNCGSYDLAPLPEGTRVTLRLEYHLHNPWIERAVNRVATPLIEHVSRQVLERIRARLA
ncbi:MAG: SRPBCC family protein [Ectothiorhodospiraceae bacterium]|nr:SRPBCC family protein [Ectothiorhodospiraceae bacterium]